LRFAAKQVETNGGDRQGNLRTRGEVEVRNIDSKGYEKNPGHDSMAPERYFETGYVWSDQDVDAIRWGSSEPIHQPR